MSVRPSVSPHGTIRLQLEGFSRYLIFEYFSKIKIGQEYRYFIRRPKFFFIMSRSALLRMKNASHDSCRKLKTHILCSITFFLKSFRLWDNVKNTVQRGRPQTTIWRRRTMHAGYLLQIHTQTV